MSNESIDEFLSWRGRLDDPRGIPGQGLDDREATWERLLDKIAERPRRRRFFGHRVAAACVLLAMVPALRFFYAGHSRVIAVRPVERQRVVSRGAEMHSPGAGSGAGSTKHTSGGDALAVAPSREDATNGNVAAARVETAKLETRQGRKMLEPATQKQPVEIAAVPTPPGALPVTIPDSAGSRLSLRPLKNKPLRVIHINELPGGPGPSPAVAAYDPGRSFKIFLSPGQNRMALPPPPPATDAALIKVRLSSPN